ncbi:MAG: PAS domain S-box protein, partial [Gammaproteobacteria bacterium]
WAEQAVAAARDYAENIVETVREPLLVLDEELRVESANRSFYRTFRVAPSDAICRFIYDLGNRQWDIPRLRQLLGEILASQSTSIDEFQVEQDFEQLGRRTILLNARRIHDPQRKSERILLAIEDITERRRAEEAVRESRFRDMIDALPAAIYTTDAKGRLTHFNPAAVEVSGRTPELGTDRWCVGWKLYRPDGAPLPHEETSMAIALKEGRDIRGEQIIAERPDGARRWLEPYLTPLRDAEGRVIGRVHMLVDITERKRAEEELRQAEERLRFVMDSMPQKIFTAKPNGDVGYFNPQWTEFTGLPFEEIGDWGWTQFVHPDDVAENVRVWQRSIDTGEPFQFEHRFRRADGEYRWHLSRALPMWNAEGRIIMWIGSSTEVHEQQQTANKLKQLAAELSEADRRKNEFLAMLAHELRNPLAPIQNALQVMRLTGGNGEAVDSAFEMMERQVGQMVLLVDDLLDVSRISRGKIDLRRGRVELASVVHHAVEACRPAMEGAKHDLTITLPPQPVYLHGDPMRLAQVIGNLLNNAGKFTDTGGLISLTVEREGEQAVIRVRDTGIGIPADELPRVFEIFKQVDTSLERSVSGLG